MAAERGIAPVAAKELRLNAYAKINLALDVRGRRPDGSLDVETVLHTLALHDSITLREDGIGEGPGAIQVQVDPPAVPEHARTLPLRAAQMVRDLSGLGRGVQIEIRKAIPVGVGLGGASADAAVTLLGLVQMWKVRLDGRGLLALASRLGADVPFLMEGGAALVQNDGQRLQWLPTLPPTWLVLARPRTQVSTGWAHSAYDPAQGGMRPDIPALVEAMRAGDVPAVGRLVGNVFEELVGRTHPVVGEIKARILAGEAYGASLSGTGPVVFGLMANEAAARKTALDLEALPDVEVLVTRTFAEER